MAWRWVLIVMCLIAAGCNAYEYPKTAYMACQFTRERDVIALVGIGTPARRAVLKVDFESSGIELALKDEEYQRQQQHMRAISNTFTGFEDLVIFDGVTISENVTYRRKTSHDHDYDGTIGLGPQAKVWRVYREASFSIDGILFGDRNVLFDAIRTAYVPVIECADAPYSGICRFVVVIDGNLYWMEFAHHKDHIGVPQELYHRYVTGQPLYTTSALHRLEDIVVQLHLDTDLSKCVAQYNTIGFKDVNQCRDDFDLRITPDMYLAKEDRTTKTRRNRLGLDTEMVTGALPNGTTVTLPRIKLPVSILDHVMAHVVWRSPDTSNVLANATRALVFKSHDVRITHSDSEMALLIAATILYFLYQAGIMHNTIVLNAKEPHSIHTARAVPSAFVLALELVIYTIAVIAILSPSVGSVIISDYHEVRDALIVIIAIHVLVGTAATLYAFFRPQENDHLLHLAEYAIRRFCFEVAALLSFWIMWLHAGVAMLGDNPWSVATALALLFITSRIVFTFVMILVTIWQLRIIRDLPYSRIGMTHLIILASFQFLVVCYFTWFSYAYNAYPYVQQVVSVYTGAHRALSLALVAVILLWGVYSGIRVTPALSHWQQVGSALIKERKTN